MRFDEGLFGHAGQPAELEQRGRGRVFVLVGQLSEQAARPEAVPADGCRGRRRLLEEEDTVRGDCLVGHLKGKLLDCSTYRSYFNMLLCLLTANGDNTRLKSAAEQATMLQLLAYEQVISERASVPVGFYKCRLACTSKGLTLDYFHCFTFNGLLL